MKRSIVVDATVEPPKPGMWVEKWGFLNIMAHFGWLEPNPNIWRCLHCDGPVAYAGGPCGCKKGRHAR